MDRSTPQSERTPLLGDSPLEIATHVQSPTHWLVAESEDQAAEEETTTSPGNDSPYLGDYTSSRFWLIYAPVLFQYFVATFDSTLMASSHPVITSYFHSSNSASWLSTAFMLTSTAFQPLFGRVSDTIGRRPMYLFALVMFAGTTAWCALAQSMVSFIVARAFCGLGAGGVMAMVYTSHFPLQSVMLTKIGCDHDQ
jgi:nitrate/nitrite transporter NarK